MEEAEKNKLTEVLTKTLNISSEGVAALFDDAGVLVDTAPIVTAHANQIKNLKTDLHGQYNRGKKETLEGLEKEIRELYQIQPEIELQGIELIQHAVQSNVDTAKKGKYDETDITKHPGYARLKLEHERQIKAEKEDAEKKVNEIVEGHNHEKTFGKIEAITESLLTKNKFLLPADPEKRRRLIALFNSQFKGMKFKVEGEQIIPLDDEGRPKVNDHNQMISFESMVTEIASGYFESDKPTPRTGSPTAPPSIIPTNGEIQIKDDAHYLELMKIAKTPDEKMKILDANEKRLGVPQKN